MTNEVVLNAKPKKWIALVLGFFASPLAFLYVGRPRVTAICLLVGLTFGVSRYFLPNDNLVLAFGVLSTAAAVLWAWLASRYAGMTADTAIRAWYSRWYGLVSVSVGAIIVVALIRIFLYEPYHVPSSSMLPTLKVGANVTVQKWGYGHYSTMGFRFASGPSFTTVNRGDIIAFDYPRDPKITYLQRVIGLPGDEVVYHDKHLFVNGVDVRGKELPEYLDEKKLVYLKRYQEKLAQSDHDILINESASPWLGESMYMLPSQCTTDHETISCRIPPASYFVMGDNRDNSADSRYWGFVPATSVLGKVVHIVTPRS